MIKITNKIKISLKKKFIGLEVDVFISKYSKQGHILGRTMEYKPVLFYTSELKLGTIIKAKIIDIRIGYLIGIYISKKS